MHQGTDACRLSPPLVRGVRKNRGQAASASPLRPLPAAAPARHAMIRRTRTLRPLRTSRLGAGASKAKSRLQRIRLPWTFGRRAIRAAGHGAARTALRLALGLGLALAAETAAGCGRRDVSASGMAAGHAAVTCTDQWHAGTATPAAAAGRHAGKRVDVAVGVAVGTVAVHFTGHAGTSGSAAFTFGRRDLLALLFHAESGQEGAQVVFFQLFPAATFQAARQGHGAVAGTDQARHGQTDRFEHAAHFAVAAFA